MTYARVLGLLLCSAVAYAGDVALLVDVSGTMRGYGDWQKDALELVTKILSGNTSPATDRWEQLGELKALPEFSTNTGTLHVVRFGSTQSDTFPFFSETQSVQLADLRSSFPLSPEIFKQPKTNKPLAQAVGSRMSGVSGTAHLIIVSDFLVDAALTRAQDDFVKQSEAAAQTETPMIYSWRTNPRVQIKLIRARITPETGGDTLPPVGAIQLIGSTLLNRGTAVQFRWRLTSSLPAKYYQVLVRDVQTNKIVFTRSRVLGESLNYPDPPSGRLTWQVVATLENDSQLPSSFAIVTIPGANTAQVILALIALAAVILLTLYLRRRRQQARTPAGH